MRFAAIDIGTNAVRLLLSKVVEGGDRPVFEKESFIRMPLRLGEDTFLHGRISDEKTESLAETMIGFRHLINSCVLLCLDEKSRAFAVCRLSLLRPAAQSPFIVLMLPISCV